MIFSSIFLRKILQMFMIYYACFGLTINLHFFRLNAATPPINKVWLMGGAELTKSFAAANLIDEVILFTVNKAIGEGIPLGVDLTPFDQVDEGVMGEEFKFKIYRRKNTA